MTSKELFEKIMKGEPKIVKHTYADHVFNICDECNHPARAQLWVWFSPDSQVCLDCFYRLSGGVEEITVEVLRVRN